VTFDDARPVRVEAVPLFLDYCHTRLATGDDAEWIARRFESACAAMGTAVERDRGRLVIDWDGAGR
jgi:poly-gamma-glutamate synthesis protein (capsule biosynthesis protein)